MSIIEVERVQVVQRYLDFNLERQKISSRDCNARFCDLQYSYCINYAYEL